MKDYLSVVETAAILGVHQSAIRRYIKQKLLPAEMIAGSWVIPKTAIANARGNLPKMGRPPKVLFLNKPPTADESAPRPAEKPASLEALPSETPTVAPQTDAGPEQAVTPTEAVPPAKPVESYGLPPDVL